MDCRETRTLLTAFHDGELPAADRARVEEHLGGCPGCGALLADMARADAAAGVPDPGPGYWDRFNARVMERVGREAEGPGVTVLRPKRGWVRQQLRYLVPAAAAAALVVVVVRHVVLPPGGPTPTVPPAVLQPAAPDSAEQRAAREVRESPAAAQREPAAVARRVPEGSSRIDGAPAVRQGKPDTGPGSGPKVSAPSPSPAADERFAAVTREERGNPADRSRTEAKERTSADRAAVTTGKDAPSPPPAVAGRGAPAVSPPVAASGGFSSRVAGERQKMAAESREAETMPAAKAESVSLAKAPGAASPCELARSLAAQGRWKEAEAAQRACLAQDRSAPAQEKGLVFLAELLDRQDRFADADAVIAEVHRQFPRSLPLDLYRQQRPMVQKQQVPAPVTR
jgi:anti-sigma factor RsiW